jgi:uncharacterized protein YijF (DUF1287 family)
VTRAWVALLAALSMGVSQPRGDFFARLSDAALAQVSHPVVYDPSYRRIGFPGGDVPAGVGVCSDVVIRAYRALGVDFQARVHADMTRAFAAYPRLWGLSRPDPNIDHRRVPNLATYLARHGAMRPVSARPEAYATGDLVVWMLPGNRPHIGIVTARRTPDGRRPLVVHNAGVGPRLEDALFAFPITGHFRYRE